ncbi:MAG TPA: hypothetical protein VHC20_02375 [Candidatus Paceibacterota bacterium]|nr:hypothetical protein [Candidatus Paceibacterota bacterium]
MKGFAALTSVLIIAAVLLVVVVSTSVPVFYARMDLLESEWEAQSALSAQSCADLVNLRRVIDHAYSGGDEIEVGEARCAVSTIVQKGNTIIFTVQSEYHGSVTVLEF